MLVALLGVVAFAGHLSEGAAIDWAALHARLVLDADPAAAPLAYTVFAVAMTSIRLLGDPIRARLGAVRTIQLAGGFATVGYLLVLLVPNIVGAWIGWALAGVGLATVVPVVFSAVGAAGGSVGRALSVVTAFGYSGLLVGPAVLGFVADSASLPVALIIPAVMAAVVGLTGTPAIRAITTAAREGPGLVLTAAGHGTMGRWSYMICPQAAASSTRWATRRARPLPVTPSRRPPPSP
ncbi:hypothetical protein ACFQGX_48790 [Nonomuraea dietziae]|uniref:hypothetical protein n=1 Tax=Nonomuraea dietziae TaxID=65515 RepID=UPI0036141D2B